MPKGPKSGSEFRSLRPQNPPVVQGSFTLVSLAPAPFSKVGRSGFFRAFGFLQHPKRGGPNFLFFLGGGGVGGFSACGWLFFSPPRPPFATLASAPSGGSPSVARTKPCNTFPCEASCKESPLAEKYRDLAKDRQRAAKRGNLWGIFGQGMLGLELLANQWVFRITPKVIHF